MLVSGKYLYHVFQGARGDDRYCINACDNWGLHIRRLSVCGYGYGYRWEISYLRQACSECVAAQNHEKFTKTLNYKGSRSFKVIDVDNATVFTLGESIPAK